jgi:hypothetical protein
MKGVFPWLVHCRWTCCARTRDFCSALAAQVGPVQIIFFFTIHYFNSIVPIAKPGGQAVVLGRLSHSMSLILAFPTDSSCMLTKQHSR